MILFGLVIIYNVFGRSGIYVIDDGEKKKIDLSDKNIDTVLFNITENTAILRYRFKELYESDLILKKGDMVRVSFSDDFPKLNITPGSETINHNIDSTLFSCLYRFLGKLVCAMYRDAA